MTLDIPALDETVVTLFDRIAAASPHDLAVSDAGCEVTYGELSARADALARRLRRLGAGAGALVGLCVERSPALVTGALGIVRSGAAYVAIDPRYPDERVRWMLEDSRAAAVVLDARTAEALDPGEERPAVVVERDGALRDAAAGTDHDPLPPPPGPEDLAYVVYTSGSTGRPKGVMVEHAGLANLVAWHRAAFALTPGDRCTQIASPGFDASVWEIWPSLAAGAAVHVVPEELRRDPIGLRDWLLYERITVSFLPTAVAEGVIGLSWPSETSLRFLLTGGDALTRRPAPGLPFTLVNNYGLSETAVVATSGPVAPDGAGPPAIGRPIAGVAAAVVDERLQPVPPGVAGELMIGGVAVGPGYLGRGELTDERFLDRADGRWYRTGDRVRARPDGELEFLGRFDDQLSIRGFRVEPGEVAAALSSHPAVEASVAVGAGSSGADRRLVAYLVAENGERPSAEELTRFLGGFLPDHLIPAHYVWLEELPLTPHGKVDRGALPAPAEPVREVGAVRRPANAIEEQVASVVAGLLELPPEEIGMDQNFFLLGGHSMLGAQLIVRLESLFGVEISLRRLFDHPTLAAIAGEVARQTGGAPVGGVRSG